MERHPACIFETLLDFSRKSEWNSQFKCLDVIEIFNDGTRVGTPGPLKGLAVDKGTLLMSVTYTKCVVIASA